jgi:hypothetical protein
MVQKYNIKRISNYKQICTVKLATGQDKMASKQVKLAACQNKMTAM